MIELFREHEVLFLLLGILVFGSAVLLPALHLATTGELDPGVLIFTTLIAMWISDSAWYAVGRALPIESLRRVPALDAGLARVTAKLSRSTVGLGRLLFLSRFLYGSRIAVSIVCGLAGMRYRSLALINLASGSVWLGFLFVTAIGVAAALELVAGEALGVGAVVAALVLTAFALRGWGRLARGKVPAVAPRPAGETLPRASVVIPACNEAGFLENAIRSVRRQKVAAQVVVVENGSTDATAAIARRLAVRVLEHPDPLGYSRARNLGAEVADGACLVVLDADSRMEPGALEALLARAAPETFGTVLGLPDPPSLFFDVYFWFKNTAHRLGFYKGALGGLLFCEAGLFRRIGGFDEALEIDEINEFSRRARAHGGRYVLVTDARAATSMRRFDDGILHSAWFWCCMRFGFGRGRGFEAWQAKYRARQARAPELAAASATRAPERRRGDSESAVLRARTAEAAGEIAPRDLGGLAHGPDARQPFRKP